MWPINETVVYLRYYNLFSKCYFRIKWFVHDSIKVKYIQLSGKWIVNGLSSSENIRGDRYIIQNNSVLKSEVLVDSKHDIGYAVYYQSDNDMVKVSKQSNVPFIQGADPGDNIYVYSTSGALDKSMVADEKVLNITLPANQMYFIKVGKACYKIAL